MRNTHTADRARSRHLLKGWWCAVQCQIACKLPPFLFAGRLDQLTCLNNMWWRPFRGAARAGQACGVCGVLRDW